MNELVSVLIPLYNSELYIRDTLSSVLSQDYGNIEVIVLNDGSSDSSEEIVLSFSDRRIRYYRNEKNGGISRARNKLLSLAGGSLVLFVDSDDILSPSFISSLASQKERSGADIAVSRVVPFRRKPKRTKGSGKNEICTGRQFLVSMVRPNGRFCYVHSRLIARRLFDRVSFPEDRIFEDVFVMPLVVLGAEKIIYVPSAVYNYRINRKGLSHGSFRKASLDEMDGYLSNIELGLKIGERKVVVHSAVFFLTKYYYYYWRILFHRMGIKEYRARFRKEKERVWGLLSGRIG